MMRKSKQDWIQEGLQVLGEAGVSGLTIEHVAERLSLTKGSFYHHFADVRDFQVQLIDYWADQYRSTSTSLPDDPDACLALLDTIMKEAFQPVTEPEVAIRAWAYQDEMVRAALHQVDAVRYTFVLHVFQAVVGEGEQASVMADMFSAMLIGSLTAWPRMPYERVMRMYKAFKNRFGLKDQAG